MAKSINPKSMLIADLKKVTGNASAFETKYPTKVTTAAQNKQNYKGWEKTLGVATKDTPQPIKLKAAKLTAATLSNVRTIKESATPAATALQKEMPPSDVLGSLFSALSTLEFTKMESEYKTRLNAAKTPAAKAAVTAQWKNIVQGAQNSFASAGLKNIDETELRKFSSTLVANKQNFNAVVQLSNSAKSSGIASINLVRPATLTGTFIPVTGVVTNPETPIVNTIPDLCSRPFAQGSYTKHISYGFSITVNVPYWCPTWTSPFRVCHKKVTLAGARFTVDLNMGYRVSCCGAVAWGYASAQACVTFIGKSFCAGCSASITGVAGIGRTPVAGGKCNYGLGINAQLKCTFAGVTILNVSYPFGYTIQGPCPPAGLC